MKSICDRHQRAFETSEGCVYCVPVEAPAIGMAEALTGLLIPFDSFKAIWAGFDFLSAFSPTKGLQIPTALDGQQPQATGQQSSQALGQPHSAGCRCAFCSIAGGTP